jgi:hypothetical protein
MIKVLVTGCARGATRWAYEAIKQAGHDVGYDSIFHEHATSQNIYAGVAKSSHTVEVSWRAAPFLNHPALKDVRKVALYRDPLAVANSILWSGVFSSGRNASIREWYEYMCTHVKELGGWYRNRSAQSSLYYVMEWYKFLADTDHAAYAEKGAHLLMTACGLDNGTGVWLQDTRVNASGCRATITRKDCSHFPVFHDFAAAAEALGYGRGVNDSQDIKHAQAEVWHV